MKRSNIIILAICCIVVTVIITPYILHILSNQTNPDLIITSFEQTDNGYAGRDVIFEMDLSNQGAVTAKNCMLTLFDDRQDYHPMTSQFFDVMPTLDNIPVKIESGIYNDAGTYHIKAELGCSNTKSQSTSYTLLINQ